LLASPNSKLRPYFSTRSVNVFAKAGALVPENVPSAIAIRLIVYMMSVIGIFWGQRVVQ
jgi:hypothetical protein